MLAALLIVFREVFEAGLIVGIVLAATEGVARRGRWIAGGIAAGLAGAGLVAVFADGISNAFAGAGQEAFNASILIAAVAMLSWHNIWMSAHAAEMSRDFRALGQDVASGDKTMLAMAAVVAIAILREGSEVVLFLFGISAAGGDSPVAMLAGGAAGLAAGAAVSWLVYRGLLVVPPRRLFAVTNVMIAFLAAGMAGQAAVYLSKAGFLPSLGAQVWDTSRILADDSLLGRVLRVLIGYADRPMGVQLITWGVVLATLVLAGYMIGHRPARAAHASTGARNLISPS